MSESNAPSSTEVLRSLRLLRSPDPQERRRGIAVLVALREDPRVLQVFEHLYENDPDPAVRAAAWEAISQGEASVPAPEPTLAPLPLEPAPPPPLPWDAEESVLPVEEEPVEVEVAPLAPDATPEPRMRRVAEPRPREAPSAVRYETVVATKAGDELFLLNPANAPFVTQQRNRMARGRAAGCVRYFLAAVALVLAVALGIWMGLGWYDWYRLDQDGVDAEGQITNLYQQTEGKIWNPDEYRAVYSFPVGESGLTASDEQHVDEDAYNALAEGDTVVVTYLPDDPSITRLQLGSADEQKTLLEKAWTIVKGGELTLDNPDEELRLRLSIAALGLLLLTLLLLLLGAARRRRARYLPGGGRLLRGELVSAAGRPDDEGDFKLTAHYRFRSPRSREILQHHASQIRNDLRLKPLPAPGTPVAILYKGDKSFRML